jgi:DNA polymerase-3 subunit alpha
MPMGIITLEDLDGSIDGTMFAETFAEVTQKYPDVVAVESICFVRGKVDKKRETPSLLINEVIPVGDSFQRMTTAVAIRLDPLRHSTDVVSQLEDTLRRHKGNIEVFLQVQTSPESKVVMRLDKDRYVKPSRELVDDLELLLGTGCVQLCGAGTKRRKRQQQQHQPLFQDADAAAPAGTPAEVEVTAEMDEAPELELEEASS